MIRAWEHEFLCAVPGCPTVIRAHVVRPIACRSCRSDGWTIADDGAGRATAVRRHDNVVSLDAYRRRRGLRPG